MILSEQTVVRIFGMRKILLATLAFSLLSTVNFAYAAQSGTADKSVPKKQTPASSDTKGNGRGISTGSITASGNATVDIKNIQNIYTNQVSRETGIPVDNLRRALAGLKLPGKDLEEILKDPGKTEDLVRDIAQKMKEAEQRLASLSNDDPEITRMTEDAETALKDGRFRDADGFLRKAGERLDEISLELERAENEISQKKQTNILQAAEFRAARAEVLATSADYPNAAKLFDEAATSTRIIDPVVSCRYQTRQAETLYSAASRATDASYLKKNYRDALSAYKFILDSNCFEKETAEIAHIYHNMGLVYSDMVGYPEALDWLQKARDIREKVLGEYHPDTAVTYQDIANVYFSQGKYQEALDLYQKALPITEEVLGKEHPDTAATYNNIAVVYSRQGKYQEALDLYQKARDIREKVLGENHPDTAATYGNIASVYLNQGKYPEALDLYQKALPIKEEVLGKEHPDTALTYNNIGLVYIGQEEYPEALEWLKKARDIREKVLRENHPDTAATYLNIANVYLSQGEYPEALDWYQKARAILEKVPGKEHPDTALTYNNIGLVYIGQEEYPEALEWLKKARDIREKVLRENHPDTAATYLNIANVYLSQGDYPKALEWYQKALPILIRVLGTKHPSMQTVLENALSAYEKAGLSQPFEEWLQEAIGNLN